MAPWAYKNERLALEETDYKLDVYPLGKVLWSMIAAKNGFPYWEYDRDENDLEKLFPQDPLMPLVNELLAQCVVRDEQRCLLRHSLDLQLAVDGLIQKIKTRRGQRPDGADSWPCRMCGRGTCRPVSSPDGRLGPPMMLAQAGGGSVSDRYPYRIFVCDNNQCRHAELFQ